MAHDVFVSYSNKDKATADAVVARLEEGGSRCWIAPRDIAPGTSWGEAIETAISTSRVMVLVLSANSNQSRQVVREVERAVASGVAILPFRIEAVDPTGAMAYFLGTEHWLDALTPPMERHIERLSDAVRLLLANEPVPRTGSHRPGAAPANARRRSLAPAILAGGATLVVGGVVAVALMTGASPASTAGGTGSPGPGAVGLEQAGRFQPLDLDTTDLQGPGAIVAFDIDGSFLAYANGDDGVTRMSIGEPANPRPMATYAMAGAAAVALDGDTIAAAGLPGGALGVSFFSADGSGGAVVPIAAEHATAAYGLEVGSGYAYLASHDYVGIVDARDSSAPRVVFDWSTPASSGNPCATFVADGIGYFGAGWDGLYLFDLANPAAPRLLGHWASPNWVIDVVVAGDVAYLTLGEGGLATLDVRDPASPRLLGTVKVPGFAGPVDVASEHAFVGWFGEAGAMGGVAVVDVADPAAPALGETFRRFPSLSHLAVSGDHLFVSDESEGLLVFRITGLD